MVRKPLVSIIVVTYKEHYLLGRLLETLAIQNYSPYEIIVVDNASDNVAHEIAAKYNANYVSSGRNLGYTGGCNLGVSIARGSLILILNADTRLLSDSLSGMVHAFSDRGPRCMVVVPKIMIQNSDKINSVGMRRFHSRANLYANIGYLETDRGQYDTPTRVEAFDGAAFMFRKEMLAKTFLFNPLYFWGEDATDLAERVRLLGYEIWTCPCSVVRHEVHATFEGDPSALRGVPTLVANNLSHTLTNMGLASTILTGIALAHFSLACVRRRDFLVAKQYTRGILNFVFRLGRIMKSNSDLRRSFQ